MFKGSGCFQFPETGATTTAKESLHCTRTQFTTSSRCFTGIDKILPCTTVTKTLVVKVSLCLQLSVVHYQVLLHVDTYNTDTAINKVKLHVFYHVLCYMSTAGLRGLVLVRIWCVNYNYS